MYTQINMSTSTYSPKDLSSNVYLYILSYMQTLMFAYVLEFSVEASKGRMVYAVRV